MAGTTGLTGLLSSDDSDTSKDFYHLLNTSTKPYSAEIPEAAEIFPVNGFEASNPVASDAIVGLKSWTLNFSGRYPKAVAKSGHEGLVTYANGYVLGCEAWSMNLTAQSYQNTGFGSTPPSEHSYLPGLISGSGTFDCMIDSATATSPAGTSGAATFRLCTDTADNTLACSIAIGSATQTVQLEGGRNAVRYSFTISGNVTSAGTNTLFPAGALVTPDPTDIVLRAAGGIDYTGSAFWTSLGINVSVGSPIDITGSAQGTGALTRGS